MEGVTLTINALITKAINYYATNKAQHMVLF